MIRSKIELNKFKQVRELISGRGLSLRCCQVHVMQVWPIMSLIMSLIGRWKEDLHAALIGYTRWMFWVRQKRANTLTILSQLDSCVVSFGRSWLRGVCRRLLPPFPCHQLYSTSLIHCPWWYSCFIAYLCLRRGLSNGWRMRLDRMPLRQKIHTETLSRTPLATWMSTWAPS